MKIFYCVALMAVAALADSFGGIGVTIQSSKLGVQLVSIIPGSPADAAGLDSGDQITSVNEQSIAGMSLTNATALLRGEANTKVLLQVTKTDGEIWAGSLIRVGLQVNAFSLQELVNWNGDSTDLTQQLAWEYAEIKTASGYNLQSVLQYGHVVAADSKLAKQQISAVYMGSDSDENEITTTSQSADIGLNTFDRQNIGLDIAISGQTKITLLNLQGRQMGSWTRDAEAGTLNLQWDGSKMPAGAYTLSVKQNGLASSWEVHLQ
ncbi:MAG TPA: PDZ domain-containing protein [Fibrobacteraceae bacterium]|nr:PDZ domain-containing protein [Fibrobacteraceae bacterium]